METRELLMLFLLVHPKRYFDSLNGWRFVINTLSETKVLIYTRRPASRPFQLGVPRTLFTLPTQGYQGWLQIVVTT